jgi:hypothetical protein
MDFFNIVHFVIQVGLSSSYILNFKYLPIQSLKILIALPNVRLKVFSLKRNLLLLTKQYHPRSRIMMLASIKAIKTNY